MNSPCVPKTPNACEQRIVDSLTSTGERGNVPETDDFEIAAIRTRRTARAEQPIPLGPPARAEIGKIR